MRKLLDFFLTLSFSEVVFAIYALESQHLASLYSALLRITTHRCLTFYKRSRASLDCVGHVIPQYHRDINNKVMPRIAV
jgi:hypothetical protein